MALSSSPQVDSVLCWLQQLPSPPPCWSPQVDDRHALQSFSSFNRKRRRPLGEMESNIQTPKKLRKDDYSLDTDDTPRQPGAPGWTSPISLPPPSYQNLDLRSVAYQENSPDRGSQSQPRSQLSASSEKRSESNASSNKRKRTPSPRKNVGLRYAAYRIVPADIESWRSMPVEMQSLTKSMMIYKSGRSIVSQGYPLDDLRDDIGDDHLASAERQLLGSCSRADWVNEIISSTKFCNTRKVSEAGWNCEVHSRILRQALRCSACAHGGDRLRWHNITTASIEPSDLLPVSSQLDLDTPTTFQSRKADFALCLELPDDIAHRLSLGGVYTLNPTFHEAIRFSPLACSVETKLTGMHWEDAKTQIETWASAQISHLRSILQRVEKYTAQASTGGPPWAQTMDNMPALPFFIVQGETWHFLYLQVMAEKAVLWAKVSVGDTTSQKGVHQVLTALLTVMHWAEEVWRPWYERVILGPLCTAIATQ